MVKLVILLLLCIGASFALYKRGPYVAKLTFVRGRCTETRLPWAAQPATMNLEMYNATGATYIRGNATLHKNEPGLKLTGQQFYLRNGTWKVVYDSPKLNCKRSVVKFLVGTSNFNVNFRTCSIAKGFYSFDKLNNDHIVHFWEMEAEYGYVRWRLQLSNAKETVICIETEMFIERE